MPAPGFCPEVQVLRDAALGMVRVQEMESLVDHLAHCDRCMEALQRTNSGEDILLKAVRAQKEGRKPEEGLDSLIQKLSALRLSSENTEVPTTDSIVPACTRTSGDRRLPGPLEAAGEPCRFGSYRVPRYCVPVVVGLLLLGGLWLLAQVIIRITDRDEMVRGEMPLPESMTADVAPASQSLEPLQPGGPSPLDKLDPAQIPVEERRSWHPKQLVGIIGEQRPRFLSDVDDIAVSPDGNWVAAATDTGTQVQVFYAASMRLHWDVLGDSGQLGSTVAFSSDGKSLITPRGRWDLTRAIATPLEKLQPPDARGIASCLRGDRIVGFFPTSLRQRSWELRLWDWTAGGLVEKACWKGGPVGTERLLLSADGKTLGADTGEALTVWDVSGAEPRRKATLQGKSFALSPDGRTVAVQEADAVVLWDVGGPEPRQSPGWLVEDLGEDRRGLAFSPDGTTLVIAAGARLQLWSLEPRNPKPLVTHESRLANFTRAVFSPDGRSLYAVNAFVGSSLHAFDIIDGCLKERHSLRHAIVPELLFSPDGTHLASGAWLDRKPERQTWWDLRGATPSQRPLPQGPKLFVIAGYGASGPCLVFDDKVCEWDGIKRRTLEDWSNGPLEECRLSKDHKTMLARSPDERGGVAREELWQLTGSAWKKQAVLPFRAYLQTYLTPDGRAVVVDGAANEPVRLWVHEKDAWKDVWHTPEPVDSDILIERLYINPSGNHIAVLHRENRVSVWAIDRFPPLELGTFQVGKWNSIALSPNGGTLVTADPHGEFSVWDVASGERRRSWSIPGHSPTVEFAPDGRHIAACMYQGGVAYILRLTTADGKPYTGPK